MGNRCAHPEMDDDHRRVDILLVENHDDSVVLDTNSTGRKRPKRRNNNNNSNNKLQRQPSSLRRVTSRLRMSMSRRTVRRASTYNHVHDAVMHSFSEAGLVDSKMDVPAGVVGLRNLGNTCFINSSLQCLSNTIPLTDYFLGYNYRSEINRDNFLGTGGKLVTAYAELMKKMWMSRSNVVEPSAFKRQLSTFAPQFAGFRQHDAQELLAFLLDGIHEDLNRVKKKPYIEDKDCDGTNDELDAIEAWKNYLQRNRSLIVDLFQGQLRNTCHCKQCGHCNIRFEPFMYLSLPISDTCRSVEDCLKLYLQEERLTGDNKWYCEKCKKHVDATKKIDLWILPPILIIHLKRFIYDDFGRFGRKNQQALKQAIRQWDLRGFVRSKGGDRPIYDMYAVSNHIGSLGGGHYTAYALNRFNDQWYDFNDSSYKSIDPETAFGTSGAPYLLFYNRADNEAGSENSSGRFPLVRRQSVDRPELWPHSQIPEGSFRSYRRSSSTQAPSSQHMNGSDKSLLDNGKLAFHEEEDDIISQPSSSDCEQAEAQNGLSSRRNTKRTTPVLKGNRSTRAKVQ